MLVFFNYLEYKITLELGKCFGIMVAREKLAAG